MKITKQINGKDMTIKLEGSLDTATAPELRQVLDETINDIDKLTFDFADLEYTSSAGLRVLLTANMHMLDKGGLTFLHVNDEIMDTMTSAGLTEIFHIVAD